MNDRPIAEPLAALFDSMELEDSVPRTMLYSLNPNDYLPLVTLMGSYQKDTVQKMQLGSAWWHNDTRSGMRLRISMVSSAMCLNAVKLQSPGSLATRAHRTRRAPRRSSRR